MWGGGSFAPLPHSSGLLCSVLGLGVPFVMCLVLLYTLLFPSFVTSSSFLLPHPNVLHLSPIMSTLFVYVLPLSFARFLCSTCAVSPAFPSVFSLVLLLSFWICFLLFVVFSPFFAYWDGFSNFDSCRPFKGAMHTINRTQLCPALPLWSGFEP